MNDENQQNLYKQVIDFSDMEEIIEIFGECDRNLKQLEKENDVEIFARGRKVTVAGDEMNVKKTIEKLQSYNKSLVDEFDQEEALKTFTGKPIKAITSRQNEYLEAMDKKDLVVSIGPAGTGKTFLACTKAARMLRNSEIDRVILTRPVVESGEKLGFLPGDLYEKVNPYLRPLYDAFYTLIGPAKFQRYRKDDIIEIVPLAYMRGRTFDDSMIILDEAQNTSSKQMKMFLTRIGFNSKVVITGDITQIDLEKNKKSGLIEIQNILRDIDEISFIYFTDVDVVRHQLVRKIINAYKRFSESI